MSDLPRATSILPAGSWRPGSAVDRLVLPYEERHRRRWRHVGEGGTVFLLDLPRAMLLHAGDGLQLTDGRIVAVDAAREPLLKITAPDAATLLRLAWHLGNRHLPAQLAEDHLLIRDDPVIVAMLHGLGAAVEPVEASFTPEAGAYDPSHAHGGPLQPAAPPPEGLTEARDWHEAG